MCENKCKNTPKKTCRECGDDLPISFFSEYKTRSGGVALKNICKTCRSAKSYTRKGDKGSPAYKVPKTDIDKKVCFACKIEKKASEYSTVKHHVSGRRYLKPRCKECDKKHRSKATQTEAPANPKREKILLKSGIDIIEGALSLQPLLYGCAMYYFKCPHTAKDAIQDCFLQLLSIKDMLQFESEKPLKQFLYKMIRYRFFMQKRRAQPLYIDMNERENPALNLVKSLQENPAQTQEEDPRLQRHPAHIQTFIIGLSKGYSLMEVGKMHGLHTSRFLNYIKLLQLQK